ncbi:MAG: hypothetical protein ACR2MY_03380 [Candidatus Dormibacteria bacterium]
MDSLNPGVAPIGWTELIAGTVATLFALASTWALVGVIASGPRIAAPSSEARILPGALAAPTVGCGSGPSLGGMRLGTTRVYAQGAITLAPAPLTVVPAVSAPEAYGNAALRPAGCQTEQLLAYYSGADPGVQQRLVWVVVSMAGCGSRRCITLSPVDANTGQTLPVTYVDAHGSPGHLSGVK